MTAVLTGRSGRLRLIRRLSTAARGAELLDRKQRILAGELARLSLLAERTGRDWQQAAATARTWRDRSVGLDGIELLTAAAPDRPARVRVGYRSAMGVRYPHEVAVQLAPAGPISGSSALVLAAAAHRDALVAAAEHAAAERARAQVETELAATRARQQAIERRLIPRLQARLDQLELQLDELEREENLRLRWAAAGPDAPGPAGAGGYGRAPAGSGPAPGGSGPAPGGSGP